MDLFFSLFNQRFFVLLIQEYQEVYLYMFKPKFPETTSRIRGGEVGEFFPVSQNLPPFKPSRSRDSTR